MERHVIVSEQQAKKAASTKHDTVRYTGQRPQMKEMKREREGERPRRPRPVE